MFNKLQTKIGIIGAGPSGLGVAQALLEKGYKNITLFEKNNRVGGMVLSKSYQPKDKNLPPIIYDLGSAQPTGSPKLFRLLKEENLHRGKEVFAYKPAKIRGYSLKHKAYVFDFKNHLLGFPVSKWPYLFLDIIKLAKYLFKYRSLYYPGFNLKDIDELSIQYAKWVYQKKFFILEKVLILIKSIAMNFGTYANSIDAPIALSLKMALNDILGKTVYYKGEYFPVTEGYQEIWNRLARYHKVILNTTIRAIKRTDKDVAITFENGEIENFDKLIAACSVKELEPILDVTEEERYIFNKAINTSGWRVSFLAKNLAHDALYMVLGQADDPQIPPGLSLFYPDGYVGDDTYFYSGMLAYGRADDVEQVLKQSEQMLSEHFGATNVEWIDKAYWPQYNSHFGCEDVKKGIYAKFEALQGQNNTFYAGELISGQTNGVSIDYVYDLVRRFF